MKKLIVIIAWLFLIPTLASAQDTYHQPRGLGYGFVGAATQGMGPAAGFGGEIYVFKGLATGLEVGAAALSTHITDQTTGVGSADLSYHFFTKKDRGSEVPFVSGGSTVFFGHNTHTGTGLWGHKPLMTRGFNVGGGIDLFVAKHFGVRLEARYYGHGGRILNYTFPNIDQLSFVAFRIGFTFR